MIYTIKILDEPRPAHMVKCPPGPHPRDALIAHTTQQAQMQIAAAWKAFGQGPAGFWMQLDILDGRKPNGFSEAAKAGTLGENVVVTRKIREVVKP